ncbi:MAG: Ig-like domain-containing protein [Patescibacteria group bacterium]
MATTTTYNFNSDTVGQSPANVTASAGTFEVANHGVLGQSMRALTVNGTNLASAFMDNFTLTTNYSVIWKQAYDSTGGRNGFLLRSQSANSAVVGAKQGYYFNVNDSGSAVAPNTARIYAYLSGTITVLQSTALTSATPRWFKATVSGSTLSFFYSDDGTNYTQIGTDVTDSTYSSGISVQYLVNGTPGSDYVDDVIQTDGATDVTAPTAPTSLTGTVSSSQVALTWASSTDAVGVTAYKVYQCTGASCSPTTFVATSTSLGYTATSLSASTQYGFAVSAVDAAFNESSKSSTFATTTLATPSTITITTPKAYQVLQRNGSSQANIAITGTYTGSPTAIEASWNGGAYSTISASPSGGTYSGTLSNQTAGQGTLTVRFTNTTSTSASASYVGIGDIYVVAGQSNASGRGINNNSYSHATLKATMFKNDDTWAELADPLDSNTGQIDSVSSDSFAQMGTAYPLIATSIMADQSVPVAFLPAAKGGSAMSEWSRSTATTTLYGSMYRRINAIGGSVKGILWYQGESDADHGVDHGSGLAATRANYLSDLTTLANNVNSDFGAKLVVTQLAYSGVPPHVTYLDDVRLAQKDAWDAGGNVLAGPAFPDVNLNNSSGEDGTHFKSDADQLIQANRLWAAIKKDFYSGTDGRGPRLVSTNWGTSRSQIVLTFTDETLPLVTSSSIGGFAVTDSVGSKTISSAAASGSTVTLTLSSAATGATTVSYAIQNTGLGVTLPTDSSSLNLPAEVFQNESVTDGTAPTVSITAPSNSATVSGSSVTVSASASDNIGVSGVQFKLDGALLGAEDTTSTYGITWDSTSATNGSHTLLAVARDAAGNIATSSAITVTVSNSDVTSPSVSITAPADGATVSGSSVTVSASASDNIGVSGVQFKLDGALLGAEDTTSTYGITWDSTSATNGSHTLLAVARDAAGNRATSTAITVTVSNTVPDVTAPTAPTSLTGTGVSTSQAVLTWASSTDAVGVTAYHVYRCTGASCSPTTLLATTTVLTYTDSSLSASTVYGFAVSALDAAFNESTKSSTFATTTLTAPDTTAPTVSITAPLNSATVSGSSVTVSASASDNIGVSGVQFKLDGALLGAEDTTSTYGITWDSTSATNGSHTLLAVARDAAGNRATSTAITVTVSNTVPDVTAPSVSITAPADTATVSGASVTVSATASDNVAVSGVQFKLDGALLGSEDTTSTYGVTWDSTSIANGSHTLLAVARDSSGNLATSTAITVTVSNVPDTTAPVVLMTTPGDGVTVSGAAVSVTASASDNVLVSGVQFQIDGANLGAEDTTSPYGIQWDSTLVSNGNYVLTALARDAAGNYATSSSITVTVSNNYSRPGNSRGGGGGGSYRPASPVPAPAVASPLTRYPKDFVDFITAYKSFYNQVHALGIPLPKEVLDVLSYLDSPSSIGVGASFRLSLSPDLTLGSKGPVVIELQKLLISQNKGFSALALSAAGATGFFGPVTRSALAEFQASAGIVPASGYFGPLTKAHLAQMGL